MEAISHVNDRSGMVDPDSFSGAPYSLRIQASMGLPLYIRYQMFLKLAQHRIGDAIDFTLPRQ
eukprot:m.426203 g.426203  ORF g.426203 m.426203 type:complete len:63 (-) comp21353_c0_seq5:384-572(-)